MKTKKQKLAVGSFVVMLTECKNTGPQLARLDFDIGDIGTVTDILDDGRIRVDLGEGKSGHTFPKEEPDHFLSLIPDVLALRLAEMQRKAGAMTPLHNALLEYISDDFEMGGSTSRAQKHNARLARAQNAVERSQPEA